MVAVIVYAVEDNVPVGVPLITHVEAAMLAHAGRVGELEHVVIAAPLAIKVDGVTVIAEPIAPLVPVDAA